MWCVVKVLKTIVNVRIDIHIGIIARAGMDEYSELSTQNEGIVLVVPRSVAYICSVHGRIKRGVATERVVRGYEAHC